MPYVFVGLLSSGAVNPIYFYSLIGILLLIVYQYIKKGKVLVNFVVTLPFVLLILWGTSYWLFGSRNIKEILWYIISPSLSFAMGWIILELEKYNKEDALKKIIISIVLGFMVHALLNYSINVNVVYRWELKDFFTGSAKTATGSGCINTIALSLIGYLLLIEKNKRNKVLECIIIIPFLLYAMKLGTRTQFFILVIVLLITVVSYMIESHNYNQIIKLMVTICSVVCIIVIIYNYNLFGIKKNFESSFLFERIFVNASESLSTDQYRINSVWNGIKNLYLYPFGGQGDRSYFHNMWLDVGRIAGIIPFLFMTTFTLINFVQVFKIFKNKSVTIDVRYLLFCTEIGMLINFFVEPVIEGLFDFFLCYCLITGAYSYFYKYSSAKICK